MKHQKVSLDELKSCVICMEDIIPETYYEYKIHEGDMWTPSPICGDCIEYLLNTQWKRFLELVEKADCRAAMIRLCHRVPLHVYDTNAFKCISHGTTCEKNGDVSRLRRVIDDLEFEPILKGAKIGTEREEYIQHLLEIAQYLEDERESDNSRKNG